MLAVFGRVFKAFEQISSQLKNRYQINKFHIIPAKVTGVYIYISIYIYICVCVGIVILVSLFLVPLQLILKVKHTTGKNRQGSLEGKKLECSNGVGLSVWIVLPVLPLFQHGEYLLTPTLYPPHWTKKTCAVVAAPTAKKKLGRYAPIPFTKPPIEVLNLQLLETPTSKPNPRRSPSKLLTPTVVIRYEFGGLLLVHLNYI